MELNIMNIILFIATLVVAKLILSAGWRYNRRRSQQQHGDMNDAHNTNTQDTGRMNFGCEHYRRRCKLCAPCCNQIFTCRHCHNDFTERHELVRHEIKRVAHVCSSCGVKMGEYFCNICKFYDDDTEKQQFHCDDCRICRTGGRENFFHCNKCASCYEVALLDKHQCVENSMKSHCPICLEFLFDSVKTTLIMKCGHTIHSDCFEEMRRQDQYRCPICNKSACDMSTDWEILDMQVQATLMPHEYRYNVGILCNDCNRTSQVSHHFLGHKCSHCNSYNTSRLTRDNPL